MHQPSFCIDAQLLRSFIRALEPAVSGDPSRPHLCGIHLRNMGEGSKGKLRFEATNGHVAFAITPEAGVIKSLEDGFFAGREAGIVFTWESVKPLKKALIRKVDGDVTIERNGLVTLPTGVQFVLSPASYQYPDFEVVFPEDSAETRVRDIVTLNPSYLVAVGKGALEFKDGLDDAQGCNVDSTEQLNPVSFVTIRKGVGTFRAVVMPMRCGRFGAEEKPSKAKPKKKSERPEKLPDDFHESLSVDAILAAAMRDDNSGFCIDCGAEASGVESDARNYKCQTCSALNVFGATELLQMAHAI